MKLENNEELREIPDFPNYYISNLGKCYTNYGSRRWGKALKELKERNHPTGYKYIGLYQKQEDGSTKRLWKRVHRVVAQAFIGEVKRNMVVDHINHNKGDNRLENLQIITHSENAIRYHQYKREQNG